MARQIVFLALIFVAIVAQSSAIAPSSSPTAAPTLSPAASIAAPTLSPAASTPSEAVGPISSAPIAQTQTAEDLSPVPSAAPDVAPAADMEEKSSASALKITSVAGAVVVSVIFFF